MNFDFSVADNTISSEMAKSSGYQADERFYELKKDESGSGAVVIRFLPSEIFEDGSMSTVKKLYRYNVKGQGNAFLAIWSPENAGLKDPIHERWAKLWNAGLKEESRKYARAERYIANVKIINDTKNPENNGKIFLLNISKTLMDKIAAVTNPSVEDQKLGKTPKPLFNPMDGYNFLYTCKKGANGLTSYQDSDIIGDRCAIYSSVDEAVAEIKEKCYKLSEWDKPECYMSYEDIEAELQRIEGTQVVAASAPTTTTTESFVKQEVSAGAAEAVGQSPTADLDNLINSLGK